MMELSRDPITNAIQEGIKGDIEFALSHGRLRATVILIYAGMDAMAFLNMPSGQEEVTRSDFIRWTTRYMRFPCKQQIAGADFYGARCAMLHGYTIKSRMSGAGKCRMIGYMDESVPEVRYAPSIDSTVVLVSVKALKDAFFRSVDAFLVDAFADKSRLATLEERLGWLTCQFPAEH
jgi:hypothetical protein